jgi:uncharacterized protein YneR
MLWAFNDAQASVNYSPKNQDPMFTYGLSD